MACRRAHARAVAAAALLAAVSVGAAVAPGAPCAGVRAVVDLTHHWSFWMNGRFGAAYIASGGGRHCASNRSVDALDLEDANVLVLVAGGFPVPYRSAEVAAVERFVAGGGGLLLVGDCQATADPDSFPLNLFGPVFGCRFVADRARPPVDYASGRLKARSPPVRAGGGLLEADPDAGWDAIVVDSAGRSLVGYRRYGAGAVAAVACPGMWSDAPQYADEAGLPPNLDLTQRLLAELATGKPDADGDTCGQGLGPEMQVRVGSVKVRYPASLASYARGIGQAYLAVEAAQQGIMGVPKEPGMNCELHLLATAGSGWSSGRALGIGVFWGDWPQERFPMVEMIGHESTHSWVLPFPEPLGNEGIATYVGIEVGRRLGFVQEAQDSRARWDARARELDPDYAHVDVTGPEQPGMHAVWMGKYMFIIDSLRARYGDDVLARYFRAKRALARPDRIERYTADDSVYVWSRAAGEELFPWFRDDLGLDVRLERSELARMDGFTAPGAGARSPEEP
jgi:hypothetical protein